MASVLSEPYFTDEQAAFDRLEAIVWPDGIVCPHCGVVGKAHALTGVKDKKDRERIGLKKCYACRKQFTVRVGTVFEASHVPLYLWFQAAFLMCSSKKGISSNQLHRTLGVTLKTAWFMSHRLREAMRVLKMDPLGGAGKEVEADETFIGNKRPKARNARGYAHKHAVVSLVERGGKVRSQHVNDVNATTLRPILKAQVDRNSWLMTDESSITVPLARNSNTISRSSMERVSTCAAAPTQTRLKDFSASSNAAWLGFTSIAVPRTYNATLPNLTSATMSGLLSGSAMSSALAGRWLGSSGNGCCTGTRL